MKGFIKLIIGNPIALIGSIIIGIFLFIALAAPLLTKHAPDKRTGNPHEYPAFIVKSAQANPDGWVAENLATDRRTLLMSKKPITHLAPPVWDAMSGHNLSTVLEYHLP